MELPPGGAAAVRGLRQRRAAAGGSDFELAPRRTALLFRRELAQEGRLGFWRWFLGAWGIGTYRRNEVVDVRYAVDGRTLVAHGLTVAPASGVGPRL